MNWLAIWFPPLPFPFSTFLLRTKNSEFPFSTKEILETFSLGAILEDTVNPCTPCSFHYIRFTLMCLINSFVLAWIAPFNILSPNHLHASFQRLTLHNFLPISTTTSFMHECLVSSALSLAAIVLAVVRVGLGLGDVRQIGVTTSAPTLLTGSVVVVAATSGGALLAAGTSAGGDCVVVITNAAANNTERVMELGYRLHDGIAELA